MAKLQDVLYHENKQCLKQPLEGWDEIFKLILFDVYLLCVLQFSLAWNSLHIYMSLKCNENM